MRKVFYSIFIAALFLFTSCQKSIFESPTVSPTSLRDVPALRLNYRFESDVPAPPESSEAGKPDERNAAVQTDFDQNRPQEMLDKTVFSPDKQRVLAVYHRIDDVQAEFRLDMYSADGALIKRITYDGMAVHFPDTIVWSPDSKNVAFVGMLRALNPQPQAAPNQTENPANTSIDANANVNTENTNTAPTPLVDQPQAVLTLRTEQIYICGSDGENLKLLTQNDGLIYFYFVWSPDSSMLAALASTIQEWRYLQYQADTKGEMFVPLGRPRLVETNGRERRLDDNLTKAHPVWSPDSAKVAAAFDTQVRVYDAIGNAPTQAAIPLRNPLLISSKAYDEALQRKEEGGDGNTAPATDTNANQPVSALPDEASLVSFSPIIDLRWTEDKMLYLQTGYVKQFKNEAENVRSYLRWHRLIFSPQPVALAK
jgi:Tol biopolymer transport system component